MKYIFHGKPIPTDQYDLVLSCYSLHHFSREQKKSLYRKIRSCLRKGGSFINGDLMAKDALSETDSMKNALHIYHEKSLPFGCLHIDVPLTVNSEIRLAIDSGFKSVIIEKRWSRSAIIKACTSF